MVTWNSKLEKQKLKWNSINQLDKLVLLLSRLINEGMNQCITNTKWTLPLQCLKKKKRKLSLFDWIINQ